ncbi:MAG: tRNA 2-thiouridine(34) synthase MnmA [Gammaproteobacteria bacterium]|nr:tRNA 2-thiouridine(34) synthase MnmA [Gammaproteobacteria bacterium]NNF48508.1 tRNA 2-thiouridine(34) synthase MnmA [Woeseiaceae bacterium]MBT8094902.1 tRNA 2-thiouridine(34) synthase MnmA [Gammaproteobacteria bacterium]MBT8106316.1 tRNA 2-thiouridine(34) synthase MnmA [Gammaproteobacteria bacterium]NNK26330.1 tRNA 2-thiouridine(34) synthase MnmA [Woeseiaceae bacterium]
MTKRVILGLSGGVDSAVAAILLKDKGYDVHALHMTNWEDDDGYCTAAADLQDARRVCEQLGIPLHHANFATQYRDQVFDYFLDEYRKGRTPNPDVLCNREIKFGVFREYAKRLGGDLLATGHYARNRIVNGHGALFKGRDPDKDQSYFLHAVSAAALAETVFPLGDYYKKDVRRIARERGLVVHAKKDSTGICFIGERPFREFLATYLPANPGPMRTPGGDVVGEHEGLMYYTLGQRQGLHIGGIHGRPELPWYVVGKDVPTNALIVAQGEHELLFSDALVASDAHWIGEVPAELREGLRCAAKVRYRQPDQPCTVRTLADGRLDVRFDARQRAVAPGQFVVFYDDDLCLGGAVIDEIG